MSRARAAPGRIAGARTGRRRAEAGQASVELVALLPVLAVLVVVGWQLVVAGQAIWLSGTAARAAARAQAVGADATKAARGAVPPRLRHGLRVADRDEDGVDVRIEIPLVVGGARLAAVHARAHFTPQAER